ncbi:hypothetical protein HELRODRAFT_63395, partial [Helobdella robusta]|uniref:S-methyl-5'-thioadenosine phosphorylase n=1 Tax=Helobdella robusta TaxID=6412 RepID=T1FXF4_HELRO
IGIIGGSGLEDESFVECKEVKVVETPFGNTSDSLTIGRIHGIRCVILSRHGKNHTINPTNVNYKANIWALKQERCNVLVVSCAVGSLKETIVPGDVVILDQFIDRTTKRLSTFYDGSSDLFPGVCHIPMAHPFCEDLNKLLHSIANDLGIRSHASGTIVVIEGPRFSSRAESKVWQSYGASVVGMTTFPEVSLAAELALPYTALALVTDMDSWQESDHVDVDKVMKQMKKNSQSFKNIILNLIPKILSLNWPKLLQNSEVIAT